MEKFEAELLKTLIDKYERSVLSKDGSFHDIKIRLTLKDKALSSYIVPDRYKYIEKNDLILSELSQKNYIIVNYDKHGNLINVELNIDSIDEICNYIGREGRNAKLQKIVAVLGEFRSSGITRKFIDDELSYINRNYKWHVSYFSDVKELSDIVLAIDSLEKLEIEEMERDFSAKLFLDSKRFAAIKNKVITIIRKYGKERLYDDDCDDNEVLGNFNLVNNSTYALVKGDFSFDLNNQNIDLYKMKYEFSLSDAMIRKIKIVTKNIENVITVENLTSFYAISEPNAVVIFLSGFHNHTKQMLLKKIAASCCVKHYYHFGDIDVGGFQIFNFLCKDTGIEFLPYKMSVKELIENKGKLKKLTEYDVNRLNKMKDESDFSIFSEEINYMLSNNVKLEQEILD